MGLYDPATNSYSNSAYAYDSASLQENNTSIFDSVSNIVTKGVPLTGLAIVNSFANTGIQLANFFGAGIDEWSTRRQAQEFLGEDAAQYYDQNETAIEFGALAVGSFIPGLGALRLLKAAQATGESGLLLGRALGYFTGNRTKLLNTAKAAIAEGEAAIFPSLTADTYKAIAYGFGEQALQGLVWETATLATMRANPILSEMDLKDTVLNVLTGAALGGVIGGGFEALGTLRSFKGLRQDAILATNEQERITRLGGRDPMYGAGDRTAIMIDDMQSIPTAETLGRKLTKLEEARTNSARQNAELEAQKILQTAAPGEDPIVANSLFNSVYGFVKQGVASVQDSYDLLSRIAKIGRISEDPTVTAQGVIPTGETFFLNLFSRRGEAQINFSDLVSSKPHPEADLTRLYRLNLPGDKPVVADGVGTMLMPDGSAIPKYKNSAEAFNDGADVFISNRFRVTVNPKSERITQIAPEGEGRILSAKAEVEYRKTGKLPPGEKPLTGAPVIFNRLTGALSDTAIPVVGDLGPTSIIRDGLLVGDRIFPQTLDSVVTAETSSLDANARYVWAAGRGVKAGDSIASNDIAMLEQLRREMLAAAEPAKYAEMRTRQGVSIKAIGEEGDDLFPIPRSVQELEGMILDAKNILGADILQRGLNGAAKLTPEEIAIDVALKRELATATRIPVRELIRHGVTQPESPFILPNGDVISGSVQHSGLVEQKDWSRNGLVRMRYDYVAAGGHELVATIEGNITKAQQNVLSQLGAAHPNTTAFIHVAGQEEVQIEGRQVKQWLEDNTSIKGERDYVSDVKQPYSPTDISRRINVPEDYIARGMRADSFDGATIAPELSANIQHIKLEYDLNNFTRLPEGMVARGAIDVQYRINVIKQAALSALSGYAGPKASSFLIRATSQDIGVEGAGASFFGAANAGYGTAKQEFERAGRSLADWIQNRSQANADKLFAPVAALRSDAYATQEVQNFIFIRQTTNHNFQFLPPELAAQYKVSANTAVLADSLMKNARGEIIDWNRNFVPNGFQHPASRDAFVAPATQVDRNALHTYYEFSPKAAAFERANLEINARRAVEKNNFYVANGMAPKLDPAVLYAPPIDTSKYPFFAMIRQHEGQGWGDNSVAVVTAKSAQELDEKLAHIDRTQFQTITKSQIKDYHEVQGDYDYGRNFAQNTVNSELKRKGILNNLVPDIGVDSLVRNTIDFHAKQETRVARDFMELGNGQLFAELKALGAGITGTETSKSGFVPALFGRTATNPYNDMVKTALAISPKENYRMWSDANEVLESKFSTAFETAKNSFRMAKDGTLSFEEANIMAQKMGIGNVYSAMSDAAKGYEALSNMMPPQRYLSKFVATANSVMAATAIRLDAFQALINAVSTPVLLLAESYSANKAIQEMLSTALPTTNRSVPSTTKLMFQGVASFVKNDAERQALTPVLKEIGAIKDNLGDYYKMVDEMTLPYGKLSEAGWVQKAQNAVELGSKYTGNNLAEEMSRYVPGYVANKIFTAAGYTGQELKDNIATFVNRVQGNYAAAQRPVAFQGALGQAIGLFQTYQINMLQQILRYAANGEGKSLAILAGAQSTLFGVNGLPGFQAINQHIIGTAPGNPSHADAYSTVTSPGIASQNPLQRSVGDYILYGALSNILSTGLYSRGDISPRNVTILPINPLDFPAVSGGIKLVSSLIDVGRNISNGGAVPTSLLLGLEHNGLSRPLAGLAQLAQGYVTTGKGGIVATTRPGMGNNEAGFADLASIANFSRLLGARPLDEAIVLDTMYRSTLYKAKDHTRLEELGESFKTQAYGSGGDIDPQVVDRFAARYAAAGGNVTSFGKSILSWTGQANVSVANQIYRQLQTPQNQQSIRAMGGVRLPDFSTYNTMMAPAQQAQE